MLKKETENMFINDIHNKTFLSALFPPQLCMCSLSDNRNELDLPQDRIAERSVTKRIYVGENERIISLVSYGISFH